MKNYRLAWRRWIGLALTLCACGVPCLAQPVMSRGQQQLPVNYAECLNRAAQALRTVGFTATGAGNFAQGFKEASGAYIVCNEIPGSGTVVNIFVATIGNDAGVPGYLRQLLQAQMERPGAVSPPGGGANQNLSGDWTYRDSAFTDPITLNPDGSGRSNSSTSTTCRWSIENGQLVVRWSNGWTNVLQLPERGGVLSGRAISPGGGDTHQISLSRQGLAAVRSPALPANLSGDWTYHDGSFADPLTLNADGTGHSRSSPSTTCRASVENGELVVRWSNGWTNRLQLPGRPGLLSGRAISPSGDPRPITLTR